MRKPLAAALAVGLLATSANAATPPEDTLTGSKDTVTWAGGPFQASNPVGCLNGDDPTCDHFLLFVASNVKRVAVGIQPDQAPDGTVGFDDYDLFVYDDQGNLVQSSATESSSEGVVFANTGAAYYEVRVQPFLVRPGASYRGVAVATKEQAFDAPQECLEAVPAAFGLDLGQQVELSVLLFLDGTDRAWAEAAMARAAASYAPWNVRLVVKKIRSVSFTSTTSEGLIEETKRMVGGRRPAGIDIVGTFTNKDMQAATGGAGTVIGQADCIGGVRWDHHAFFVATDVQDIEDPQTGQTGTLSSFGLNPNVEATAEVLAHEIGHLMGAHHHYGNCVEGALSQATPDDFSPCTLMFPAVNFASLDFGLLSGAVMRGHAVGYASP
jgi:hypothetical protein